jgi:hypothetical protein
MKVFRIFQVLIFSLTLASCGLNSNTPADNCLPTSTGYDFCVTPELISTLSHEEWKATDGEFEQSVFDAGAISASTIYYTHLTTKEKHGLLNLFLFPEEKFDAAANPNEPPLYGSEILRRDGNVLSVTGPQDSIFEPETQDARNIYALYDLMHNADSWVKSK